MNKKLLLLVLVTLLGITTGLQADWTNGFRSLGKDIDNSINTDENAEDDSKDIEKTNQQDELNKELTNAKTTELEMAIPANAELEAEYTKCLDSCKDNYGCENSCLNGKMFDALNKAANIHYEACKQCIQPHSLINYVPNCEASYAQYTSCSQKCNALTNANTKLDCLLDCGQKYGSSVNGSTIFDLIQEPNNLNKQNES